jgi:sugar/nucleoside kinase (ribokinase family)
LRTQCLQRLTCAHSKRLKDPRPVYLGDDLFACQPNRGGKGDNQAVSEAKTGVKTAMTGAAADDAFGRALVDNLDRNGVDVASSG